MHFNIETKKSADKQSEQKGTKAELKQDYFSDPISSVSPSP